jgi:hypothetical protein
VPNCPFWNSTNWVRPALRNDTVSVS